MKLDQKAIADKLIEKGATLPCSRCGSRSFSIIGGHYSKIPLSKEDEPVGSLIIGGAAVPVAVVVCSKCGAITLHSLIAIGLMEARNEDERTSSKKNLVGDGENGKQ